MRLHRKLMLEFQDGAFFNGSLCGRLNKAFEDGMNIAMYDEDVTCKFCLNKMKLLEKKD